MKKVLLLVATMLLAPMAIFADVLLVGPSTGFVSIDFVSSGTIKGHAEIDKGKGLPIKATDAMKYSQICLVPGVTSHMWGVMDTMNPFPAVRQCVLPAQFLGLADAEGKIHLPVINSRDSLDEWLDYFK